MMPLDVVGLLGNMMRLDLVGLLGNMSCGTVCRVHWDHVSLEQCEMSVMLWYNNTNALVPICPFAQANSAGSPCDKPA